MGVVAECGVTVMDPWWLCTPSGFAIVNEYLPGTPSMSLVFPVAVTLSVQVFGHLRGPCGPLRGPCRGMIACNL